MSLNRTRNLPACGALLQPTAPPLASKGKVHPRIGHEDLQGGRGIALLFFNLGARCCGCSTSRLGRSTPGKRPGTYRTGGWVGPRAAVGWCGKSCSHRDSVREPPALSEWLYRLSYTGPFWRGGHLHFILTQRVRAWSGLDPARGSVFLFTTISKLVLKIIRHLNYWLRGVKGVEALSWPFFSSCRSLLGVHLYLHSFQESVDLC